MGSERSEMDEYITRMRSRAAEALGGDGTEFDAADAQHRAALLLLLADNATGFPPYVAELVEWTGFPKAFVKSVLRRFTAGGCWPRFSTYTSFDLPGPCLDTVRDVQVGLGLGIRHEEDDRVWYELSSRADDNIGELRQGWGSSKHGAKARSSARACGTACGETAPSVEGVLRLPRGADPLKAQVGSLLILIPSSRRVELRSGGYVRFVSGEMTAWLKVERMLSKPKRHVVRLLGVSSERDSDAFALVAFRDTLKEDGDLASADAPSKGQFSGYAHEMSSKG